MSGGEEATPNPENPFTRPWFLVSAGVVVLVIVYRQGRDVISA